MVQVTDYALNNEFKYVGAYLPATLATRYTLEEQRVVQLLTTSATGYISSVWQDKIKLGSTVESVWLALETSRKEYIY